MNFNTSVTEAYKKLYESRDDPTNPLHNHNNPELLAKWGADPSTLETQILCHKNGTPLDNGKFEDQGQIFGPQRWPWNAMTDPHYSDPPIQYIIRDRMRGIGSTWWDWKNRRSIGLGFDLDSLIDHSDKIGIPQAEINKLDNIEDECIQVNRSTRGNGRHIYLWFDPDNAPTANNHDEHAAIARSFLPLISESTGLNFIDNVDCCGMVLWFHHEAATKENRGFELIKPSTKFLTADYVPPNWRDNLEVVSGGRSKVRVQGWTADGVQTEGDELDEQTQAFAKTPLDETHLKILEALESTGHSSLWVHDHHLWQGHTGGLKTVFEDFCDRGTPLRGLYDTDSPDSDPGKPNCFMRPRDKGGWDVYRFGKGAEECNLWDQQGAWTHIQFNCPATLRQVCLACGGFEAPDEKMGFIFSTLEGLKAALKMLSSKITPPEIIEGDDTRQLSLREDDYNRIILCIAKKPSDCPPDYQHFTKTPKGWERVISDAIEIAGPDEEALMNELDNKLRALKIKGDTEQFESWVVRDGDGGWCTHPRENVKSLITSMGHSKPDNILGQAIYKPWQIVSLPFQSEYPGGRMWNRNAIQFAYTPLDISDGTIPVHPHWDIVMNHCGNDLDEYIPHQSWATEWGIMRGGDYLKAWVACMFRLPECKLPYLFMYGAQNSGKSTFYESLAKLLRDERGWVRADRALTSPSGFNGELAGAILAVIDEIDINSAGMDAYNKVKDWTTSFTLAIRALHKQTVHVPNLLHFVQMANSRDNLPVFPGDTRITAMQVDLPERDIPKDLLFEKLDQEAPAFLRTLLDMELPPPIGRLRLPIIETRGKQEAMDAQKDQLEAFIDEQCFAIKGASVKYADFKEALCKNMSVAQQDMYDDMTIKNRLRTAGFLVGRGPGNVVWIGNLSLTECPESIPYILIRKRLVRETTSESTSIQ